MKEFIFIRHCESQGNAGFSTHLPQTIALTEKGFEQSKSIPSIFERPLDLIVTSPFLRTKQTAEPTIASFPDAKCEEWNVQEFTYLSSVKYADTTIDIRRPFVNEYWNRCDVSFCDGDGTESFADFILRIEAMFAKIKNAPLESVAVFTHGQFMKAIFWLLINDLPKIDNVSMKSFHSFLDSVFLPNAAVFRLFVDGENFRFSGVKTSHLPKDLITF